MKVIFLKTVTNVAEAGQIKEVKDGYGRNYLLPQKIAALATPDQLQRVNALKKAEANRQMQALAELKALGQRLEETPVVISARVGANEQLYGSVTNADIAQELSKMLGTDIDRRMVELLEPLKQLGTYQVQVRVSQEIAPMVTVTVQALEG